MTRRVLLLAVAALLCAAALFAIAVLVLGRFGGTETRIVQTTMLLAGYGLLAVPSVLLLEKARRFWLARTNAAAAVAGAAFGVAVIWRSSSALGRVEVSLLVLTLAAAQAAALVARQRPGDPPVVARLYLASAAAAAALAVMLLVQIWAQLDSAGYGRALGVVAIVDVVLVALQPLLARLRPPEQHFRLLVTLDSSPTPLVEELDAPDLAAAAARAIRHVEHDGVRIVRLDVERRYDSTSPSGV